MRDYTPIDRLMMNIDTALRTVAGKPIVTHRTYPADKVDDCEFKEEDRKHIASLMRVNHSG